MKSFKSMRNEAIRGLKKAWSTLGTPASVSPLQEAETGIIDPEACILLTMFFSVRDRLSTDVPAWILRFSDLVNHQKLKSLFTSLPSWARDELLSKLRESHFAACPPSFLNAFGLKNDPSDAYQKTLAARQKKLKPIDAIARDSLMVHNRLLFGTTYRADLVSLTRTGTPPLKGNQIARLLAAAESTVSRIVSDLTACGFLDRFGQPTERAPTFPGLFLSADTFRNMATLLEASRFTSPDLREDALSSLDLRFDGLTRGILKKTP